MPPKKKVESNEPLKAPPVNPGDRVACIIPSGDNAGEMGLAHVESVNTRHGWVTGPVFINEEEREKIEKHNDVKQNEKIIPPRLHNAPYLPPGHEKYPRMNTWCTPKEQAAGEEPPK